MTPSEILNAPRAARARRSRGPPSPRAWRASVAWMGGRPGARRAALARRATDVPSPRSGAARREITLPCVTWTLGLFALAASLASLAVVGWLILPDRLWRPSGVSPD